MNQPVGVSAEAPIQPRDSRLNVFDLTPEQLGETMLEMGEPAYRARQVLHWLYKELASSFSQMTNLPSSLRKRLEERLRIGSAELVAQRISEDGWTRKVLLRMRDGATVETVLMLYYDRASVCVSSQVGCAMGCTFCATGQMGFMRNLTSGEIVEQIIWFNRWLREHPHRPKPPQQRTPSYQGRQGRRPGFDRRDARPLPGRDQRLRRPVPARRPGQPPVPAAPVRRHDDHDDYYAWHVPEGAPFGITTPSEVNSVTNVVFMGMGEPLVNYHNLWQAIHTINSPQGLGLGARRMTVSTVGIVPAIRKFAREGPPVNLAVSLHAPNDEMRSSMVPMNKRYSLELLLSACREYTDATARRITFEYVLISGKNDSLDMARQLRDLVSGMLCHVNLIPLNPVPGTGMQATPREQVYAFQKIVEEGGVSTTVRIERGVDIAAACGQLKIAEEPGSRKRSLNPDLVRANVEADLAAAT